MSSLKTLYRHTVSMQSVIQIIIMYLFVGCHLEHSVLLVLQVPFLVRKSDHVPFEGNCWSFCHSRALQWKHWRWHECVHWLQGDELCLCRCSCLSVIAQAFAGLKKTTQNWLVPRSVRLFWLEPWNWNNCSSLEDVLFHHKLTVECAGRAECLCQCVFVAVSVILCVCYLYCRWKKPKWQRLKSMRLGSTTDRQQLGLPYCTS